MAFVTIYGVYYGKLCIFVHPFKYPLHIETRALECQLRSLPLAPVNIVYIFVMCFFLLLFELKTLLIIFLYTCDLSSLTTTTKNASHDSRLFVFFLDPFFAGTSKNAFHYCWFVFCLLCIQTSLPFPFEDGSLTLLLQIRNTTFYNCLHSYVLSLHLLSLSLSLLGTA